MQRIVLVVVVIAVIAILFRASLTSETPSATPTPQVPPLAGTLPEGIELPDFLRFTQVPRIIPTPHPDSTWAVRMSMSGTENTRSEAFELTGNLIRLRYSIEGNITILALSLIPDNPDRLGAFPDVVATRIGDGERLLTRSPGMYRLIIQTVSGNYTVSVEEEQPPSDDSAE